MIEKEYTILAQEGLHARPAKALLKVLKKIDDKVMICKDQAVLDAKSMLGILSLQAGYNSKITVTVEGGSEEESIKILDKFFEEDIIKL